MGERGCLVVRLGAIGDTVLTVPALRALRQRHRRLVVVGGAAARALLPPVVDRVLDVESSVAAGLFLPDPSPASRAELGAFDEAVVWLNEPDVVAQALRRIGIPRVHAARARPAGRCHVVDHLLATIGEPPGALVELPVTVDARRRAAARLSQLGVRPGSVLLAIGAGGVRKRWPAERFADLADRVDRPVAVLAGPADGEALAVFRRLRPTVPVVDGVELAMLPALLSEVTLVVANDSGPGHLAAAVGTSVVALFGPTDPAVWAPRGRRVSVLYAEDGRMDSLAVADVASAVRRALA
jgi:heptosyltransferase-3